MELLRDHELAAGAIAERFEVSRPAISQHIRVLFDAGLLTERREGTRRLYQARPEGLASLRAFLESFGEGTRPTLDGNAAPPAESPAPGLAASDS